jgi:tetratricopeptide (TPR) repeat protein
MKQAHQAHPEDPDTAALYALSLLTEGQRVDDRDPLYDEAEAVLRRVHEEVPTHPGAIHYSIHATDVDGRAENALDMVDVYGEIAPQVAHALHMPSHIYVRLGDWPEVIDWNLRSADAALERPVNGSISHHYIHAMDYVLYAQLQRGEDANAAATLDEALHKGTHQASFVSAFHAAVMPARHAVERQQWEDAVALEPRTPDYLPWDQAVWAEGLSWYARGLGAVHTGDLELAREAEERLTALRDRAEADGDQHFATYIEVDRQILAGWIAHAEGNADKAIDSMRTAADLERTVEKHPVSPGALVPPNEALGDLLAALERPAEALEAYRVSQEMWPKRYHTLLGAGRTAIAIGDEEAAKQYYGRLRATAGDSQRPGVVEARQYLDQ